MGVFISHEIAKRPTHKTYILAGYSQDFFQALDSHPPKFPNRVNIVSANPFVGLGWKFYGNRKGNFIKIEVCYNFTNYNNPGGTPLTGGSISIRICGSHVYEKGEFKRDFHRSGYRGF